MVTLPGVGWGGGVWQGWVRGSLEEPLDPGHSCESQEGVDSLNAGNRKPQFPHL